ncbi:MAG: TIGR03619 family F420-dependent LLM class oxidoreductase [Actinomycetes bacterium]
MRWSLALPTDRADRPEEFVTGRAVAEAARAAEDAGLDAVYVTDHPAPDRRWLEGGGHHALEPTVALAFAAAATQRVRLHTNVYVAAYRNPFLAAKAIASLDVLAGGRVILGVAAGYLRPEFGALGVDFDERNDLLDEAIETMRRVWTEEEVAVEGRHFRARAVTMLPRPDRPGGPPIWVGGNSTAAIRRAVARGQGWVPFPNPPAASGAVKSPAIADHATLAARLDLLRGEVARTGRTEPLDVCFAPFASPTATLRAGDGARLADEAAAAAALGVTWMTVGLDGADSMGEWRRLVDALASDVVGSAP